MAPTILADRRHERKPADKTIVTACANVILSQRCTPVDKAMVANDRFFPGMGTAILLALLAACAAKAPPPRLDATQCLDQLDRAGVRYAVSPTTASTESCGVDNPVQVSAAGVDWNQPGVVSCAFATRLDALTREVIEPAALARFGERVRRLRHLGTYSCRRENGGTGRWSQHASGNAIDIAGFELESGAVILVERDWRGHGAKRQFLRDVARRACERFSVVLTPDSDRDHHDHIHLDGGPYKLCGA
jgi:hypothetical protein